MKVLIACGGTGGHIFPALTLAEELKRRGFFDISFIIDDNTKAKEIIDKAGFEYTVLDVPKMPYGLSLKWPNFIMRVIGSQIKASHLIEGLNPDIVIGFGAYISGPVVSVAKARKKKTLIHEQNAVFGRANRLLLNKADKICLSFDSRFLEEDKRFLLTGNPIRQNILEDYAELTREEALLRLGLAKGKKTILVVGGSKGASSINRVMMELLDILKNEEKETLQFIHITGSDDFEDVLEGYKKKRIDFLVKDFYDRMGLLYKAADIVICRAGAATIAEVCLFGLPAIFIPYPHAGSHQKDNAEVVAATGGAIIMEEKDITAAALRGLLLKMVSDTAKMQRMGGLVHSLSKPNAVTQLADTVEELIKC